MLLTTCMAAGLDQISVRCSVNRADGLPTGSIGGQPAVLGTLMSATPAARTRTAASNST